MTVPVVAETVTDFVQRIGINQVAIIKADAEGAELAVLRGSRPVVSWLALRLPPIQPAAGPQYTSIAFTTRLVEVGVDPSVGSVGDALDNALAETTIGSYQYELI
jgi:transposase InsO family protein